MTDTVSESAANAQPAVPAADPRRPKPRRSAQGPRHPDPARPVAPRPPRNHPVLEQLAGLYPRLFGEVAVPLKRGIFQDLLAAHPQVFEREALKAALALHTRSTRYLTGVAAGQQRHDLQGQAVEDMAPEHVHHALLEVFRRRQGRTGEDLRPTLRDRIVTARSARECASASAHAAFRCPARSGSSRGGHATPSRSGRIHFA